MIRIQEFKIKALEKGPLPAKIEQRLHLPAGSLKSFSVVKESIDARQKPEIFRVYSVDTECEGGDEKLLRACRKAGLKADTAPPPFTFEVPSAKDTGKRPVIAGFGPCGIFAGLVLAKAGARPVILERGPAMDERIKAVELFWKTGKLDLSANCQFGEGGAGTFSDGKLTTGTKSEFRRFVLEEFVRMGADPSVLYRQKPHVGTDVIRKVVVNIRKEIEALGGEVRFSCTMKDIRTEDGLLKGIYYEDKDGSRVFLETDALILALGHSARDSVRALFDKGIYMEKKPFSMGLRIEHPQSLVDRAQYGADAYTLGLGPADYNLNVRTADGRGVYTFCMCPGGEVVNASSHEGCVTCNGMSYFRRDSGKANSALLADVRREDIEGASPMDSIAFQEKYERLAFRLGGGDYSLPTESLGSFMTEGKLKACLPPFIYEAIREAVPMLGKKLKGFDDPGSLLYAIESRSSSPVRITRDENGYALMGGLPVKGLYPAGEGAGYAGGIMSAACDGIKAAVRVITERNREGEKK